MRTLPFAYMQSIEIVKPLPPYLVDYLVVGGGGGGNYRGGGFGGGFTQGSGFVVDKITVYTITVGPGGVGGYTGLSGGYSNFTSVTAGGGVGDNGTDGNLGWGLGGTGASGGYGSGQNLTAGGAGLTSTITGGSYAGGGGGFNAYYSFYNPGFGQSGGGRGEHPIDGAATNGNANSGGGGGGGSYPTYANGGTGVVILRTVEDLPTATYTGATFSQSAGFKIYTFTGTGTIQFN